MMASLATALFRHDRIKTTLSAAKALRPYAEKIITMAKKAASTEDKAEKLHYFRQALSRVRDEEAVHLLFSEKASKFLKRSGGYTRIYKLVKRDGDGADVALIELIEADDAGYTKPAAKKVAKKKTAKKAVKKTAAKAEAAEEAAPAEAAAETADKA